MDEWQKQRERERSPTTGPFPPNTYRSRVWLGQSEEQETPSGLLGKWQGFKYFSHHPLPPDALNRKLDQKQITGTQTRQSDNRMHTVVTLCYATTAPDFQMCVCVCIWKTVSEARINRSPILWFTPPNGHSGQDWTRKMSRSWNSMQISHLGGRDWCAWVLLCCFSRCINRELNEK